MADAYVDHDAKTPLQEPPALGIPMTEPTAAVYIVEELPHTYLMLSILMLVFCFWPLGILAVYMSLKVQDKLSQGDIAVARQASKIARIVNFVGIAFGMLIYIGVTLFLVLLFLFVNSFCNSRDQIDGRC